MQSLSLVIGAKKIDQWWTSSWEPWDWHGLRSSYLHGAAGSGHSGSWTGGSGQSSRQCDCGGDLCLNGIPNWLPLYCALYVMYKPQINNLSLCHGPSPLITENEQDTGYWARLKSSLSLCIPIYMPHSQITAFISEVERKFRCTWIRVDKIVRFWCLIAISLFV